MESFHQKSHKKISIKKKYEISSLFKIENVSGNEYLKFDYETDLIFSDDNFTIKTNKLSNPIEVRKKLNDEKKYEILYSYEIDPQDVNVILYKLKISEIEKEKIINFAISQGCTILGEFDWGFYFLDDEDKLSKFFELEFNGN